MALPYHSSTTTKIKAPQGTPSGSGIIISITIDEIESVVKSNAILGLTVRPGLGCRNHGYKTLIMILASARGEDSPQLRPLSTLARSAITFPILSSFLQDDALTYSYLFRPLARINVFGDFYSHFIT